MFRFEAGTNYHTWYNTEEKSCFLLGYRKGQTIFFSYIRMFIYRNLCFEYRINVSYVYNNVFSMYSMDLFLIDFAFTNNL